MPQEPQDPCSSPGLPLLPPPLSGRFPSPALGPCPVGAQRTFLPAVGHGGTAHTTATGGGGGARLPPPHTHAPASGSGRPPLRRPLAAAGTERPIQAGLHLPECSAWRGTHHFLARRVVAGDYTSRRAPRWGRLRRGVRRGRAEAGSGGARFSRRFLRLVPGRCPLRERPQDVEERKFGPAAAPSRSVRLLRLPRRGSRPAPAAPTPQGV